MLVHTHVRGSEVNIRYPAQQLFLLIFKIGPMAGLELASAARQFGQQAGGNLLSLPLPELGLQTLLTWPFMYMLGILNSDPHISMRRFYP